MRNLENYRKLISHNVLLLISIILIRGHFVPFSPNIKIVYPHFCVPLFYVYIKHPFIAALELPWSFQPPCLAHPSLGARRDYADPCYTIPSPVHVPVVNHPP